MTDAILSTYRIQLNPVFNFDAASEQLDYFKALGVSHVYCSPYLQAARGSQHGYDVVDHSHVNEELGGEAGHEAFCARLGEIGLGQVLDIVPNHMAVSVPENRWWWDVLENGPSSRYADYFDVDWEYPQGSRANQVLLPILGNHYGRILESGEIRVERDGGMFFARYYDHLFPIDPRSLSGLLGRAAERAEHSELGFLASALDYLPFPTATDRPSTRRRHRDKEVIREKLATLLSEHAHLRRAVDAEVDLINSNVDRLDAFLSRQNYRLAYWRIARSDLGYRRFFDINNLIAIRVEDQDVFADTHERITDWLRRGVIDGLRIDHADGLRDPEQYFSRLRHEAGNAWIVAEKILHPGEQLPDAWSVAGTTGYDFLAVTGGLFVRQDSERAMTDFYRSFTGEGDPYHEYLYEGKQQVLHDLLGSDVNRLVVLLSEVCEHHRRFRDFTREDISEALIELLACFPVYRTYTRANERVLYEHDRRIIENAVSEARERREDLDAELFDLLYQVLTLELDGESEREFVMRFQQLTGPTMAKGGEDTAFYQYNRLVCLNEVGSDPGVFGTSIDEFHKHMEERAVSHPRAMLCSSTHDTKRSEDVRARLAVVSEYPSRWAEAVWSWSTMADDYRTEQWPDRNIEYLIYQTLVGAWPIDEDRMLAYIEKAMREAKTHTTWTSQNELYEASVFDFAKGIMNDSAIMESIERFVELVRVPGYINSLANVAIKLLGPGIPDIYQGCELWDLSLVDPDNRRPVDYARRRSMLEAVQSCGPDELWKRLDEGAPKLALTTACLKLRDRHPEVFAGARDAGPAGYKRLEVSGPAAENIVAFSRDESILCVVPRFPASSTLEYPETTVAFPQGTFRNVLTGRVHTISDGSPLDADDLLSEFPVGVFESVSSSDTDSVSGAGAPSGGARSAGAPSGDDGSGGNE